MDPAWHALAGPLAGFALGDDRARRFRPDIGPIAALPDEATPADWAALASLVGPDGPLVLLRPQAHVPASWTVLFRGRAHQMVAAAPVEPPPGFEFDDLGRADEAEMLELALRTEPGPFAIHTRELGSYIGVREGGRLVAMAGQRLRLPGYIEVSAVCTAPEQRGRGLGNALTAAICGRIAEAGATPFLHVREDNDAALRIYERMGFRSRCLIEIAAVRPPDEGPRA